MTRITTAAVFATVCLMMAAASDVHAGGGCGGGGFRISVSRGHRSITYHRPIVRHHVRTQPVYTQPVYHPTVVQPTIVQPTIVQPTIVQPTVVQPTPVTPISSPPTGVPATPPANSLSGLGSGQPPVARSNPIQALGGFAPPAMNNPPAAQLAPIGNWVATLGNGATVRLQMQGTGEFSWTATNQAGAQSAFAGTFQVNNGQLILVRSGDQQQLAGTLSMNSAGGFEFRVAGSSEGLNFNRG